MSIWDIFSKKGSVDSVIINGSDVNDIYYLKTRSFAYLIKDNVLISTDRNIKLKIGEWIDISCLEPYCSKNLYQVIYCNNIAFGDYHYSEEIIAKVNIDRKSNKLRVVDAWVIYPDIYLNLCIYLLDISLSHFKQFKDDDNIIKMIDGFKRYNSNQTSDNIETATSFGIKAIEMLLNNKSRLSTSIVKILYNIVFAIPLSHDAYFYKFEYKKFLPTKFDMDKEEFVENILSDEIKCKELFYSYCKHTNDMCDRIRQSMDGVIDIFGSDSDMFDKIRIDIEEWFIDCCERDKQLMLQSEIKHSSE